MLFPKNHSCDIHSKNLHLCKVLVYELKSEHDVDMAATIILMDAVDKSSQFSSSKRPKRREKSTRDMIKENFSLHEIRIHTSENLAYFKLLLKKSKGKKLAGQRLFLLCTGLSASDKTHEELLSSHNAKSIQEVCSLHDIELIDRETQHC